MTIKYEVSPELPVVDTIEHCILLQGDAMKPEHWPPLAKNVFYKVV